jgi:hypothetical protein
VRLRPAFVNLPVRPIDVATQCAPLFFRQSAVGTLPAFRRWFGAAKFPLVLGLALGLALKSARRLVLKSARRLALRLGGEHAAGRAVPRTGGHWMRERRQARQNGSYQDLHQP